MKSLYRQFKDGNISNIEYLNYNAQRNGFKDYNEYRNNRRYITGKYLPMSENSTCPKYLGVHIAERVLEKVEIFKGFIRMPEGTKDYDFLCPKGYKINVKSSCLSKHNDWNFYIRKNKIVDYFLLLAFDNREDLNPLHIWLLRGKELFYKKSSNRNIILNEMSTFTISNTQIDKGGLKLFTMKKYELVDKLDKIVKCCNKLKDELC